MYYITSDMLPFAIIAKAEMWKNVLCQVYNQSISHQNFLKKLVILIYGFANPVTPL